MPYNRFKQTRTYSRPAGYIARNMRGPVPASRIGARDVANYAGMAYSAYKLATNLKGIINSELKHYDESTTMNPDNTSGTITAIVRGMAQGDTNNTMDGNSILLKSVNLRFSVIMNASATCTRLRFLLLKDTRPNSALPAITDILSSSSIQAFMNIDDQLKRFRVLADKKITVNTQNPEKQFFISRKFKQTHVKFNDAQLPVLNDFYVACISDEPTNTPTINMTSRLRFYDN